MMMLYEYSDRFVKQSKKLFKKYKSIGEDLEIAKIAAIELLHIRNIDNGLIHLVPGFDSEWLKVYKIKKFSCKSLAGKGVRSGIRVIYAYFPKIEKIEFLEIYYKEKNSTDMDYDFAKLYFTEHSDDLKKE